MYKYTTLEHVSDKLLYDTFLEAFQGFPIVSKANIADFHALLESNKYDPMISVGAFHGDELVAFVLNSIRNAENEKTAYMILTGTKPLYRRQGIMSNIFRQAKEALTEKKAVRYYTEVLVDNAPALHFYQAQGFEIKNQVMTVVSTRAGEESVLQYEIMMNLY